MEQARKVSLGNGLWICDWSYNLRIMLVFAAIEILLAYSPFGFIVFSTISFSTLFVCVMVSALWGGPVTGAAIGLVYGLCSMWKATVTAVNPMDLMFSPFKSGNPVGSWLLTLGPRVLFGIAAGLLYYIILKFLPKKVRLAGVLLASVVLERVQSALTYLFIDKVFHVKGVSAAKAIEGLFEGSRILTWAIVMVLVFLIYELYEHFVSKRYYREFCDIREAGLNSGNRYHIMMVIAIVAVGMTAVHLWERIQIIVFEIDKCPPEYVSEELFTQVIVQFMVAAVCAIYVVFVLYRHARNKAELLRTKTALQLDLEKEHAKELEIRALKDSLTGVFNRKGFRHIVSTEALENRPTGFLLVDIDHFKEINDTFGHEIGDKILIEITEHLTGAFGENHVFRFGGDEFAVLMTSEEPWDEENIHAAWEALIEKCHLLYEHLADTLDHKLYVTLSVGACFAEQGYHEKLYPLADLALYETKNRGRAGCTLVDEDGKLLLSWRDEEAVKQSLRSPELKNSSVGRLEYAIDRSFPSRFICDEMTRGLFGFSREASPEECFAEWKAGILPEYLDGVAIAEKALREVNYSEFTYVWNHPLKGRLLMRSGGVGEFHNGVMTVLSYHLVIEVLKDE